MFSLYLLVVVIKKKKFKGDDKAENDAKKNENKIWVQDLNIKNKYKNENRK